MTSKEAFVEALRQRHGKQLYDRFAAATVAICGLGGLGSHVALSLARAGVGKLILLDFDSVDVSNLHRQQYKLSQVGLPKTEALAQNIREVNPYTKLQTHTLAVTADNAAALLQDADIVCEAFDDAAQKAMLVNTVLAQCPDKILVAASGMAGLGDGNDIRTRRITPQFYLCGDEVSDVKDGIGLVCPRVMLCAAHQALVILQILAGKEAIPPATT